MHKNLDFTYNRVNFTDLPIYVEELQESGMRVVIIMVNIVKYLVTEKIK